MTLFGIIWLLVVIWAFFSKGLKRLAVVTLLFMTFQSVNVITISGGVGVGPQLLTSLLFIIKSLYLLFVNGRTSRRLKVFDLSFLVLIALVFVMLFSTNNAGNLDERILYIAQFLIYVVTFALMRFSFKGKDITFLKKAVKGIIIFIAIMGVVQFLSSINVLPIRTVLEPLFYNDPSENVFYHYEYFPRVMSIFMEPSYFAGFVVGAFFYILSDTKHLKKNLWLLILLLVEIILTKSSTAYGAFLIVGLLFLLLSKGLKLSLKVAIFGIGIAGFLVLYINFYEILDEVIFSKINSSSGIARYYWNVNSMTAYNSSPVFGVGYKNIRGSSIFYSLLGELGVMGLTLYILFNVLLLVRLLQRHWRKNVYYRGALFAIVAVVACQVIACPDLDLCTYWFWLYVLSAFQGVVLCPYKKRVVVTNDEVINQPLTNTIERV